MVAGIMAVMMAMSPFMAPAAYGWGTDITELVDWNQDVVDRMLGHAEAINRQGGDAETLLVALENMKLTVNELVTINRRLAGIDNAIDLTALNTMMGRHLQYMFDNMMIIRMALADAAQTPPHMSAVARNNLLETIEAASGDAAELNEVVFRLTGTVAQNFGLATGLGQTGLRHFHCSPEAKKGGTLC